MGAASQWCESRHLTRSQRIEANVTSRTSNRWSRTPEILVALILVLAVGAWQFDLGRRLGISGSDPAVTPKPATARGLQVPTPTLVAPAEPAAGPAGDPAKVRAAIGPLLHRKALGRSVGVEVVDLATGKVLTRSGPAAVTPASTMKLLTSVAALEVVGGQTRFETTVTRRGHRLFLVGGGDPLLTERRAKGYPERASLADLADQVASSLPLRHAYSLRFDASLFSGPSVNPAWPPSYRTDGVVPPISALWDDEGRAAYGGFVADPAADAAADFAAMLRKRGVRLKPAVRPAKSPAGAVELAQVSSPPLADIVGHLLAVSDNNAAEVVAHHVGLAQGTGGSFEGGVAGVRRALRALEIPLAKSRILDGSGLSRQNRLAPETLSAVLRVAASPEHPQLRVAVTGMPVAGYTGSLTWRFDRGAAAGRGRVQAKTGTLTGVHGLAGVVSDTQGSTFGFVMIADQVPLAKQLTARILIDEAAAALAACACGSGTP